MNAPVVEKKSPRVEQERARRRRREDMGVGRLSTLSLPKDQLDPNYTYRWINDDPGRVHALTVMDDWEKVTSGDIGESDARDKNLGTGVERIVDKVSGKRAVLVRKPKDYYLEDKAKEQKRLDELDQMIRHGQVPTAPKESEGVSGRDVAALYVPEGGISIRNGSKG